MYENPLFSVRLENAGAIQDTVFSLKTEALSAPALKRLSKIIEKRIRDRTAFGLDVNGKSFLGYSKAYKKRRLKEGLTPQADLSFTGEMLRALKSSVNPTRSEIAIYFSDPASALKAFFHNDAGVGKSKVTRRFFGLSKRDLEVIITEAAQSLIKGESKRWKIEQG